MTSACSRPKPIASREPAQLWGKPVLRVGLLLDHPSPHMVELLNALAQRSDCAAQVVYLHEASFDRDWGAPTSALPYKILSDGRRRGMMSRVASTARTLASARADIWVINTIYTTYETWAAAVTLNALNVPWVYMNEPIRPRSFLTYAKECMLRLLLTGADGTIGMGEEPTVRYRALTRGAMPSISVPYYIPIDSFYDIPHRCCSGSEPVRFFSLGQLIRRKGYDILCAAATQLPQEGWTLTIAGDGPMRAEIEGMFRAHWSEERVQFVGSVPYEDRPNAFSQQHVFVFPSRWDGWGMAPVEALSASLPVISTDQVMSMREFIVDGQNGFVVSADDASALASRMQWFLENPGRIPEMSILARASTQGYRAELGVPKLVSFLEEIEAGQNLARVELRRRTLREEPRWRSIEASRGVVRQQINRGRLAAKSMLIAASSFNTAQPWGDRILAYHLVLREDRRSFSEHLKYLCDHFELTTAEQVASRRNDPRAGPMAAVSFDDSFRVLLYDALELLEKHCVKATFYVPTGFVERAGHREAVADYSRRAFSNHLALEPMNVEDLRLLRRLGHEIGSHGVSHLSMSDVSEQLARRELDQSRTRLAEWLGAPPSGFAYPYGSAEGSLRSPSIWVAEAGYRYAVTLRRGNTRSATDPMLMPREHVEGNWPLAHLKYFLCR